MSKRDIEIVFRENSPINLKRKIGKIRAVAYIRVSTKSTEQEHSFEAQRSFYDEFIKSHKEWIFCGIYSDEGVSGMNKKRREGFNRMIQDAVDGRFDLIITKSISRFARNTIDSLMAIRQLKLSNVEVYFQKENIYTFDMKGEFLLTLWGWLCSTRERKFI